MTEISNSKQINKSRYDLEDRSKEFALTVALFCKKLPYNIVNNEYIKQLIRSASSVGANYIEANESLGKKDFLMKIRICRKEAKESAYWLALIVTVNQETMATGNKILQEAIELKKIFSAILEKSK